MVDWLMQTAAQVLQLNTARIRDVELLTGLQFFRNPINRQDAVRLRVSITDALW